MALHAAAHVQLLLENLFQQFQPEATHCECARRESGGHMQRLPKGSRHLF